MKHIPIQTLKTNIAEAMKIFPLDSSHHIIVFDALKSQKDVFHKWTFHLEKFENIVIFLEDKRPETKNEIIYEYNIMNIRNMVLKTAKHAVIIHNGTGKIDEFQPMNMTELNDLHEYCEPVYIKHYNNANEVDENILAGAILNRCFDGTTENILIITYDCGENIREGLELHTSRPIEYIPTPQYKTIDIFLKNSKDQGSILVIDFLKNYSNFYDLPSSIRKFMRMDCPSIMRKFINIVIFL